MGKDDICLFFFFSSRRRHTRWNCDWSSDVCSSDLRNTFATEKAGSLISESPNSVHPVKGITSIDGVALLNVEGARMIGVPGTAQRLFGALREDGISVILISQGSSEHSICFAIPQAEAERTAGTVRRAFHAELSGGQIQDVGVVRG